MLTLKKCREILGYDSPASDADLELLRDQLYGLARVAVEASPFQQGPQNVSAFRQRSFCLTHAPKKPQGFSEALAGVPEEDRYAVEERAAILEFDGGLDRNSAERTAFSHYWLAKQERK